MMEFKALNVPTLTEEIIVNLKTNLAALPGIKLLEVAHTPGEIRIIFDDELLDFRTLAKAMTKAGCPLQHIHAALLSRI